MCSANKALCLKKSVLVGGGAKSALWRQVVADTFDCTVVCPESSEAGAMGAALQAMWCYLNEKEAATSFEEITQQYIFLDESTRTDPQKKFCRSIQGNLSTLFGTEQNHDSTF